MNLANEPIFSFLAQFAYEPVMVYSLIISMMFASSFGLPIPEEITLISAGFITHMAIHPEIYPPPFPGAASVTPVMTAIICFASVFLSDFLVFMLGRKYGTRMIGSKFFTKYRESNAMKRVEKFTEKYGAWACGIFRFTPGLRFPGHFACGSLKIPIWKFVVVDGLAALLSVPTQVLLIAYYGEEMLGFLKEFKIVVFSVLGVLLLFYIVRKLTAAKQAV
jgi:membrane protein DedA with SNARE-associated domain